MSNVVLSNTDYSVIGSRPIRPDGADKVTGRAQYGADFQMSGLLYGKVLRSPYAHARIKSIDTTKAEAYPGVVSVVTAKDIPTVQRNRPEGGFTPNENVLAVSKALYKGHAIAAVSAVNIHVAESAIALIDVDYEVLPSVVYVRDAMKEDAPLVQETLTTMELGEDSGKKSNIATHFRYELGDPDKGFSAADVVVEREFSTKMVHQGYIEPQNASALWNADGHLTVWTSTQGAFNVRELLGKILQKPVSDITVVPMEIGGGFGGKLPVYLEPLAALLSKKSGRPVKLAMTRTEVFDSTGPTSGAWMRIKVGATKDGKIMGAEAELALEAGAFPGAPVTAAAQSMFAPYDIANMRTDGYDVLVNRAKVAPYRAPGAPIAAFGSEQVMDEVAQKVGMDPLEFRLKNASKEGSRRVDGPTFAKIGNVECIEAAKNTEHYKSEIKGPYRGRGIASGYWANIGKASSCSIGVNPDGTITLVEGSTDIGGSRASIGMQAAEVLGLAAEDVHPTVANTDSVGYTFLTGGSRTTFATGWAAYEAAQDIKAKMIARAATIWEVDPDNVDLVGNELQHKSDPELKISFKELAGKLADTGGPISSQVSVDPAGQGGAFSTQIADVEVDPDTGKVTILRFTIVQDAGKAIHPSYVEGQMQGAVAQGIGWALNEEYYMGDQDQMVNSSFLDYRMPTSLDLPMIDTVIVEVANPGHPYGVRGVGEVPIVPPMAAVANAIADALKLRLTEMPMSPGAVLEAIWSNNGEVVQAADD